MILITQLYKTIQERWNEQLKSLKNNVNNPFIKQIILLNEETLDIDFSKVKQVIINKRLTYKLAFDWAKHNIPTGTNVILVNSDIWFDNSISLIHKINMSNTVITLSRYDIKKNGLYKLNNVNYSQDSWIFQNPITLDYNHDFELGRGACDNRIAYIIKNSKKYNKYYILRNPALLIKSYHEHLNDIRHWKNYDIKGPYLNVDIEKYYKKKPVLTMKF